MGPAQLFCSFPHSPKIYCRLSLLSASPAVNSLQRQEKGTGPILCPSINLPHVSLATVGTAHPCVNNPKARQGYLNGLGQQTFTLWGCRARKRRATQIRVLVAGSKGRNISMGGSQQCLQERRVAPLTSLRKE